MVALAPAPTEEVAPATRTLTGGQLLCEALLAHGLDTLFGYPGGAALPFYRDLAGYRRLRHVLVRHEQNAAHAADGYARKSGRVGVCVATSGPGATNLLTGLATAFMDCVPVLAITGQVARAAIGTQAFQEVDVLGMVGPITKAAFQLEQPADIPRVVAEAVRIATSGRPGPVLIDMPKDVQLATVEVTDDLFVAHEPDAGQDADELSPAALAGVEEAAALLRQAERPLLIAGHGVVMAGAARELRAFADASGVPVGTTLLGLGAFPQSHPQSLGMVGMHGTVQSNLAMHHADVIVGVGMRFDDRVVGRPKEFAPNARIVHVDLDPHAFGRVVRADVAVLGDAKAVLAALTKRAQRRPYAAWWQRLREWTRQHSRCGLDGLAQGKPEGLPTTPEVVRGVRAVAGEEATVVADIGQHQMYVALHHGFEWPGQMFTSGGLGTMGYALPAAMGVKVADPDRPVWVVVGDGGFQMSAPELSTLAATPIPLKVVVVNNQCLGMVRQWQELFYDGIYSHSLLPQPDFAALARAHGCWSTTVNSRAELEAALRAAAAQPGPAVVDVRVPVEETVYPMVPAGSRPGDVLCVDQVDTRLVPA
jgi:acetolactate synthase I/II/III large subunit